MALCFLGQVGSSNPRGSCVWYIRSLVRSPSDVARQ
jgi:hypothetical protein